MDALDSITTRDADGRRILTGSATLPPIKQTEARSKANNTNANPKQPPKKNTAGRFAVLNAFVDCSLAGLRRSEIAVWLVLYRDVRDGSVRTSQADIARRAGLSDRAVRSALAKLEQLGLLVCIFRGGLNRGTTRYRVEPLAKG